MQKLHNSIRFNDLFSWFAAAFFANKDLTQAESANIINIKNAGRGVLLFQREVFSSQGRMALVLS